MTGVPPAPAAGAGRRDPDRTEVLVVRHGHAGTKEHWDRDDRLRPLTGRGRAEAAALVDALEPFGPARIVTSPLVRCRQTVEPLARRLGLPIQTTDSLEPGAGTEAAILIRRLAQLPGPTVVCTHGETIAAVQADLQAAGDLAAGPVIDREKGSVWVLQARHGRFVSSEDVLPEAPRASDVPTSSV